LVIVELTSWSENGLTDLDFEMANQYEKLYKEMV
jgi:4a-hydroxytetrahydrobiopterin dehydratase